jgi:3-oxoacyl-[acyl-carrier-protein] synthase II
LSDPFLHFAVAGATMALRDSGLLAEPSRGGRTGTCIATAFGGVDVMLTQQANLLSKGPRSVSPMTVPFTICDMACGYVSIMHKLAGPNHCLVSACASGASAVGEAFHMIQRGSVDAMVAGAADAMTALHCAAFASARALSTANADPQKASRPFDLKRDGFVLSEGSAMLVLEELEQAVARGAPIYGELVGYGSCSDAYHITAPDPSGKGAVRAMREAIAMAGIEPERVDYINAHATSTPLGDKVEVIAIREVFGKHVERLPISSTKSMTGHMIGAAGSVEAVFCLLAMRDGILPPTINQEHPDPECDIDTVPNVARPGQIEYALTNSFGFGGHNVSLLFRRLTTA